MDNTNYILTNEVFLYLKKIKSLLISLSVNARWDKEIEEEFAFFLQPVITHNKAN